MKSCMCCGQDYEPPTGEELSDQPIRSDYCIDCSAYRCDIDVTCCASLQAKVEAKGVRSYKEIPDGQGKFEVLSNEQPS